MGHSSNMSSRKINWFKSWEVFKKNSRFLYYAEIDVISYELNNK